jgi:hypothetical protein
VAARSKAWNIFAHSDTGIVGSNPTEGMDVSLHLFCVYVVLYVGRGLGAGWSLVQGLLLTKVKKLKWSDRKKKIQDKDNFNSFEILSFWLLRWFCNEKLMVWNVGVHICARNLVCMLPAMKRHCVPGVLGQSMKYPNYFNITYILSLCIIYNDKCYLGKVLKESRE